MVFAAVLVTGTHRDGPDDAKRSPLSHADTLVVTKLDRLGDRPLTPETSSTASPSAASSSTSAASERLPLARQQPC